MPILPILNTLRIFLKKKKKKLHKFLHCVLSKNRLWQEILVTILYFIRLDYILKLNSHL